MEKLENMETIDPKELRGITEETIMKLYSYIRIADIYTEYYDQSIEILHLGYLISGMEEAINKIIPYYCSLYSIN